MVCCSFGMRSRRHRRGLHKALLTPSLHGSHTSSWYMALQNSSMRPLHDRLVTHCSGTCSGGIPSRIQASPHEGSSNVFVGASSTDTDLHGEGQVFSGKWSWVWDVRVLGCGFSWGFILATVRRATQLEISRTRESVPQYVA